MIRYALECEAGHAFESWFRDSEAFDRQARAGHVTCAVCGSVNVGKQIMAPAVSTREEAAPVPVVHPADQARHMRLMLKALKSHLQANAENVGVDFAAEARKIHLGEAEERAIYGVATPREARELNEEGIEVVSLPDFPEDTN